MMSHSGYADVIMGTQYGDEGKARIVDGVAKNYDIIARFNGGANAGHTLVVGGKKIALKQVPSGIFYNDKLMYIGSGCVVNLQKLKLELDSLKNAGIDIFDRFKISSQAGVIQPHHILMDEVIGKKVGTTRNGIGPAYSDRALRMWDEKLLNIRMGDLLDDSEKFFRIMKVNFDFFSKLYELKGNASEAFEAMKSSLEAVAGFIEKDTLYLQKRVLNGNKVIFEGAQSFMLDINKGSPPYVTSSSTIASAAYVGGDLSPDLHRSTIGVAKAIMSRVGHGPFASEFGGEESAEYCMSFNKDGSPLYGKSVETGYDVEALIRSENPFEVGKALRILSDEYGTVTARPRRVGALDLIQLSYAVQLNGITRLVITKCDLLSCYAKTAKGEIPLITGYELDGERIDYVPGATSVYARVKPVIEYRPGFPENISAIRDHTKLPTPLKDLLNEIEEFVGCKIGGIGVGPDRNQYISINNN